MQPSQSLSYREQPIRHDVAAQRQAAQNHPLPVPPANQPLISRVTQVSQGIRYPAPASLPPHLRNVQITPSLDPADCYVMRGPVNQPPQHIPLQAPFKIVERDQFGNQREILVYPSTVNNPSSVYHQPYGLQNRRQ